MDVIVAIGQFNSKKCCALVIDSVNFLVNNFKGWQLFFILALYFITALYLESLKVAFAR